jgi:6-phosphogluconolactonase
LRLVEGASSRKIAVPERSKVFDRRMVLAGLAAPMLASRAVAAAHAGPLQLLAGTYAREGGRGLARIAYDPVADTAEITGHVPVADASYGVWSPRFGRRYVVQEGREGAVAALGPDGPAGPPVPTGGAGPCFIALDARQSCLAVANYDSGSVSLIRLDPADGRPVGPAQVVAHHGSGPVRERQAGPHAHWVGFSPDGRWLHSVDLGADAIFAHLLDAQGPTIGEGQVAYAAPPGSGPRHLVRHPSLPRAYLVSELANSLTELAVRPDGRFEAVARLSTLPDGFAAHSQAAHIAIDATGARLYVSNRGANTLAVFALDGAGRPSLMQQVSSGGDWPRFFLLLERENRVLVANERSGEVAILHRAPDGRLADSGRRVAAPGVVFLMA